MTHADASPLEAPVTAPGDTPPPLIDVAIHAQNMSEDGNADPFPPEGTDDKLVQSAQTGDTALSDEEGLNAARYVIASGLGSEPGSKDRRTRPDENETALRLTVDAIANPVAASPPPSSEA